MTDQINEALLAKAFADAANVVTTVIDDFAARVNKQVEAILDRLARDLPQNFQRYDEKIRICSYNLNVDEQKQAIVLIKAWMDSQDIEYDFTHHNSSDVTFYVKVKSLLAWRAKNENKPT